MQYKRRLILLYIIDSLLIISSILIGYLLRFEGKIPNHYIPSIYYSIIFIWPITFSSLYLSKFYRSYWQFAGAHELKQMIYAISFGIVASGFVYQAIQYLFEIPYIPASIFFISWMLFILSIGGFRLFKRFFQNDYIKLEPYHKKSLIIGAGKAGMIVAQELTHANDTELYPVAFVDDDPQKVGLIITGIPVLGTREDIVKIVKENDIKSVIIALPSAPKSEITKILDICKKTKTKIKIIPKVSDLINGKVTISAMRDVNVEDLLGREPIEVDLEGIASYVTDKVVMVTGAGGSIGSELCRQISNFNPKRLLMLGHGENSIYSIQNELKRKFPNLSILAIIADIQDRKRIEQIFKTYKPVVIFHAAAHKHVPLMEENPYEAIKNNILGTRNVAECAHKFGAEHFVLISTDKAVNPTNVMGATKRVTEMIIQSLDRISPTKFVAVRFGNVLGSRGSVIPLFKEQIKAGGPVTVTHPEMIRYFMTIPEAVQLVIQAGAFAKGGEIFILDMGEPVKISKLAYDLISLSGFEPGKDIKIEYTGIRPGEKLYEELLTSEEGITATKHNRIFIGKPINFSNDLLEKMIQQFDIMVNKEDIIPADIEIKRMLKQIVLTYNCAELKDMKGNQETEKVLVVSGNN